MTRKIISVSLATLMVSALALSTADAATRRHHSSVTHTMRHASTARTTRARGGDAQNATVDQLNAQSLNAARGGATQ